MSEAAMTDAALTRPAELRGPASRHNTQLLTRPGVLGFAADEEAMG
jgi:hypothetical protein